MNDDPLAIATALGLAIEAVGGRWAVGGSVASSVHGVPRTTQDLDLVVALAPGRAADLARAAPDFFIDEDTLAAQLRAGRSFNVFHAASMTKVDLFPARGAFEQNQLDRAVRISGARVMSAEDALLAKLRWFRLGEETSERQWRDVLGIVATQRGRLDLAHLRRWAGELGVLDLLERALPERGGGV